MDQVAEIKSRVDIAQIIGEKNWPETARPEVFRAMSFSLRKNSQLYRFPEMGIFKCFGCGAVGDVFTFLEKHDGMTFVEALEFLAEKPELSWKDG